MKILVTGGTGLIGRKLGKRLVERGHELIIVSRNPKAGIAELPYPAQVVSWDSMPTSVDGVIHLAGESVAGSRWTKEQKRKILVSRVEGTRKLWSWIAGMPGLKPNVFVSASAVGIYGDRGDELLTESAPAGQGFLSEVTQAWEKEIFSGAADVRTVAIRIGIVLAREGGALPELERVFATRLGGPVGSGRQWMSWIHIDDLVECFVCAVESPGWIGVINGVSPHPATNTAFSAALGRALGVPSRVRAPSFAIKAVLGEMSQVVLSGQRASCEKLQSLGFRFRHTDLDEALTGLCRSALAPGEREHVAEQWIPRPPSEVFSFFSEAGNLETLTPPWLGFRIVKQSTPRIEEGTLIEYKLKIHGVPYRWKSRIEKWLPQSEFVDVQLSGPYKKWHHTHRFIPVGGGTLLVDRVVYRLPMGWLGGLTAGALVRKDVQEIFKFRRQKIHELFARA